MEIARKSAPALRKRAAAKAAAPAQAVVIGRQKARGGKVYQVLAPAVTPKHLSPDDIEQLVEIMVAAR